MRQCGGVAPASVRRPRLGSEAITLPLSMKPGSVRPSRRRDSFWILTPLIARSSKAGSFRTNLYYTVAG
jgi:hypothetical protein